jgi:hypothetical protein
MQFARLIAVPAIFLSLISTIPAGALQDASGAQATPPPSADQQGETKAQKEQEKKEKKQLKANEKADKAKANAAKQQQKAIAAQDKASSDAEKAAKPQ